MEKTVIIIGAGVAGLSAGIYAQLNGYRSRIFELHDLPGGLCTAWQRKDYIFDGCIHYLFGSGKGQPFSDVWEELGALQDRQFVNHSEFMRVQDGSGRELILYCDPDRLEQHLNEISPADAGLIHTFCGGIRTFTRFDMSNLNRVPRAIMGPEDWRGFGESMLPFLPAVAKWALVSAGEFAARFKDPFLRRAMAQIFAWPEIPMLAALSLLAYLHTGNAGFPLGGSLEFVRSLERRYLELGGEIEYKAQVEKILVEEDRAVGVRLYNDQIHRADVVISACDGRGTIFDMLGGKYVDRHLQSLYDGRLPIHSAVQVSWGIRRDLSREPHWVTYLLDEPLLIAGEERLEIGVKHYCFDPSLAPAGKSCLIVLLKTNYAYWQRIYGRRLYDTEQEQVADILMGWLERRYPGLRADVEVTDVTTPLSYERYTGNWLGSTCGFLLTKETSPLMIQGMRKTLPGLGNFYLAGQWVEPGGSVPLAAMSGRNAIQLLCHADGKKFAGR